MEAAIKTLLIPALLELPADHVQAELRTLLSHGVKAGGMNLRNPKTGADRLFQASKVASGVLVALLRGGTPLDSVAHRAQVRGAGTAARKEKAAQEKEKTKRMQEEDGRNKKKLNWLQQMGECGIWISLTPHELNGTLLSRDEWLDNTRLRYGFKSKGLCSNCDGCAAPFTVEHGLSYKKVGLVSIRHDDECDKAGALAGQALTTGKITYEASILW